jgi:parallel beta-helix repeat protein
MRRAITVLGFVCVAVAVDPSNGTPPLAAAELVVDDDREQCLSAGFTTIQAAVDAAPRGALIRVCAGTYDEQVTVTKRLRIRGEDGAVVMPSAIVANTTNLATSLPIAAAILVMNTNDVTIARLTVDGARNGIAGCEPTLVGIFFRNASGRVRDAAVRNMKLGPGLEGCQSGFGIFAQSGGGGVSRVEVERSSVHDFQKNGITGNGPGTDMWVTGNVVTGLGPTSGAVQNGIVIASGATGQIEQNVVINHISSPCVSASECTTAATNILVLDANGVAIARNTVGKSQVGISHQGNNGTVQGNTIFDTDVLDGIALSGDGNVVEGNTITNSDQAAISVEGDNNAIIGNRINEAPVGVLEARNGGVGNVIEGNSFFSTPTPVLLSSPAPVAVPE